VKESVSLTYRLVAEIEVEVPGFALVMVAMTRVTSPVEVTLPDRYPWLKTIGDMFRIETEPPLEFEIDEFYTRPKVTSE
jgi:hypothetical protein